MLHGCDKGKQRHWPSFRTRREASPESLSPRKGLANRLIWRCDTAAAFESISDPLPSPLQAEIDCLPAQVRCCDPKIVCRGVRDGSASLRAPNGIGACGPTPPQRREARRDGPSCRESLVGRTAYRLESTMRNTLHLGGQTTVFSCTQGRILTSKATEFSS